MIYSDAIVAEMFEFLDDLRQSGGTNMYGAAPYLVDDFGLTTAESRKVLSGWMATFDRDKSAEMRASEWIQQEDRK